MEMQKTMKGILILLILTVFLPVSSWATLKVHESSLANGLRVLVIEDHKAPVVTFQVWYKVGSRDDPKGKTGISHLLEHMMFKGSKKFGEKQFSRIIQRNGGIDNAYTTKDYTMYFETLSSDRIDIALELEADRMENLLLKPDDVLYERSVVMEERRMRYEDDPQNLLFEDVVAAAFKVHPYHNPVIGWMNDLKTITQKDLLHHYRRYYSPDNTFIVVAGDVNAETIINKIKRYFEHIPNTEKRPVYSFTEPAQKGEKRVKLKKEATLPYLLIAYHVPSFPHEDAPALDVLSYILSGKSGRLYKGIVRDEAIAIDAFVSYSGLYRDPFLFFLGGTPRPGHSVEELEKALYKQIEAIQKKPPTEREIQKAKNQVEASFIMGQDSIYNQARLVGTFQLLGSWRLIDEYLQRIRSITPKDVQEVAKKYFGEDNRTVGILIPTKKSGDKGQVSGEENTAK
jgi:zinc protease